MDRLHSPPSLHNVHLFLFFFQLLRIYFEIKKQNFSRIFVSKLSRWLRYSIKNLQCCELIRSYYQQCTTGTFFTVLGYMCLSFTSVNLSHQNLPHQNTSGFPSVMKKTSLLYIQSPPALGGEHSISIYEQLELSSAKSAWVRGFPRTFMGFSFSLFILFYYKIFLSSSSSRPYQYITAVFRNSLPSGTENTHKHTEEAKD